MALDSAAYAPFFGHFQDFAVGEQVDVPVHHGLRDVRQQRAELGGGERPVAAHGVHDPQPYRVTQQFQRVHYRTISHRDTFRKIRERWVGIMTDPGVVAGTVVAMAAEGRFADVEELFAPRLRAAASAETLRVGWETEIAKAGPVTAVGGPGRGPRQAGPGPGGGPGGRRGR